MHTNYDWPGSFYSLPRVNTLNALRSAVLNGVILNSPNDIYVILNFLILSDTKYTAMYRGGRVAYAYSPTVPSSIFT